MPEPIMEKPPVYYDAKGVAHVKPADILLSRVGQERIKKAAAALAELGLPASSNASPAGRPAK